MLFAADLIARFFGRTLLWLLPALAVWYAARDVVVVPVASLSEAAT